MRDTYSLYAKFRNTATMSGFQVIMNSCTLTLITITLQNVSGLWIGDKVLVLSQFALILLFQLCTLISALVNMRRLKRRPPLTQPQRQEREEAHPIVLQARVRWSFIAMILLPLSPMVILMLRVIQETGLSASTALFCGFWTVLLLGLMAFKLFHKVKITLEQGTLTMHSSSLELSTAQSFRRYTLYTFFGRQVTWLELSSADYALYWQDLSSASDFTQQPQADYAEQHQRLIETICSHTGLPLMDCSSKEPTQLWPPQTLTLIQTTL